jgi:hypothetical protein
LEREPRLASEALSRVGQAGEIGAADAASPAAIGLRAVLCHFKG